MKNRIKNIIAGIFLVFFLLETTAQEAQLRLKTYVDSIFTGYFSEDSPGAAVTIVKGDTILLSEGYGLAHLDHNVPITPETNFHIVSGSKQFTAFAVLLLEKQGLLTLQDEIHQYLPELHDFGKPITIEQLLTHTSGLRQETQLESVVGFWEGQVLTQARALELIFAQRELNFDPGSAFNYSNSGYTLLAEIIKRITEEPFETWMAKNVFQSLGMHHTTIVNNYDQVVENRAEAYDKNDQGYFRDTGGLWQFYGGTGVYTSVKDLSLWLGFLSNPWPEYQDLVKRMQQQTVLRNGERITWGLGVTIDEGEGGYQRIWHAGDGPGYHAWIGRYPKLNLGIAILSNLDTFEPEWASDAIARFFISEDKERKPLPEINETSGVNVGLDSFEGWYLTDPTPNWYISDLWRFQKRGNTLYFNPDSRSAIALTPISGNRFQLENLPLTFAFLSGGVAVLRGPDGDQTAKKLNDGRYAFKMAWAKELVGTYHCPELNIDYELFVEDDQVMVRHLSPYVNRRWNNFSLQPIEKDYFVSDRGFFTHVRFVRNDKGKVIGLRMTVKSERIQNLWFEKN